VKVELKRLQIYERMSEETTAFNADVWINGKKAGYAKNDGHGGNTDVRVTDRALAAALSEYGKTLVLDEYKKLSPGDEWIVDDLVEKARAAKETARVAKKSAKIDAQYKATCPARGTHAARFKTDAVTTRWIEFRDESAARGEVAKKYGAAVTEWTVIA
jgi:hypothetical protein